MQKRNAFNSIIAPSVAPLGRRIGKVGIFALSLTARYAYVTIHYEGTKRDDEYALAVRVWAKSLFAHGISRRPFWEP